MHHRLRKRPKPISCIVNDHARIREMVQKADLDLINRYMNRDDWKVRENSNTTYSLQGLNNYISSRNKPDLLAEPGIHVRGPRRPSFR